MKKATVISALLVSLAAACGQSTHREQEKRESANDTADTADPSEAAEAARALHTSPGFEEWVQSLSEGQRQVLSSLGQGAPTGAAGTGASEAPAAN